MNQDTIRVMLMCSKADACEILKSTVESLSFEVNICSDRESALGIMAHQPQDIIITEYDLHDSTGVEFLTSILDICKQSTRIIIGEQANEELIVKAVIKGVASTYIEKNTDGDLIREKLDDIARVRRSLNNDRLKDIFPESNNFPINMTVYEHLMEAINEDKSIHEISAILSQDVTLTAKVLQVANSAFYGSFSGTSIDKAIIYMGLNPVKDIVLMHSLTANLRMDSKQNRELEEIMRHSITTNFYLHAIAKKIDNCPITPLNNSVGVIHDIGKLVQLVYFPMEYRSINEFRENNPGMDYRTCELETGNDCIGHAEIGAYFLRLWNFNQYSVESALYHHDPEHSSEELKACIQALFLANTIADIRDGFDLSLEAALEQCDVIDLMPEDITSILPPL